jgi:hypothetical protein
LRNLSWSQRMMIWLPDDFRAECLVEEHQRHQEACELIMRAHNLDRLAEQIDIASEKLATRERELKKKEDAYAARSRPVV